MKSALRITTALASMLALATAISAGLPKISPPEMPHLPDVTLRVPEVRIPPIELPDIPVGHKTNKWEIRHNLEKGGWWVAYGKEIGEEEYVEFATAIAASVASDNPGPAMAYLENLVKESVVVLENNAGREFGDKLKSIAEKELVAVIHDAIKNGKVRTIKLKGLEVQLGVATYNRSESGLPLPNTFQPYMRMRLTIDDEAEKPSERKYHWVTTIYNPTNTEVKYKFNYDGEWKKYAVEPKGGGGTPWTRLTRRTSRSRSTKAQPATTKTKNTISIATVL
jgi:hypothetical protein